MPAKAKSTTSSRAASSKKSPSPSAASGTGTRRGRSVKTTSAEKAPSTSKARTTASKKAGESSKSTTKKPVLHRPMRKSHLNSILKFAAGNCSLFEMNAAVRSMMKKELEAEKKKIERKTAQA